MKLFSNGKLKIKKIMKFDTIIGNKSRQENRQKTSQRFIVFTSHMKYDEQFDDCFQFSLR